MRIEVGQLGLDLPQQRVVGVAVGRIERHRLDQHRQQVFERADVVIDLGGQNPRLVDGTLGGGGAVALPLTPERGRHQSRQRNHGRQRQSQEA